MKPANNSRLAETPAFPNLENACQPAAYAGLTPSQRTSLKGKSRLSKIGSVPLRKSPYFPAIVDKKHNLKEFATNLEAYDGYYWSSNAKTATYYLWLFKT